jgi:hypothetical protein
MTHEVRSCAELQVVCLQALKRCEGFEHVDEILVQPREVGEGITNWTLAAVRPRVDNRALRAARSTIEYLQQSYALPEAEAVLARRRRPR